MMRLRDRGITVIPAVVDFNLEEDRPWFAMSWYEDGSLEDRVRGATFRDNPLVAIRLLIQIARAVELLHKAGVAHRDLKPANILLDRDKVVIADLGLCLDLDETSDRLTTAEEAVGSRFYIAPENESGINETVDQRPADFYAFGKILWAVLAGRQPPARERQLQSPWTLQEQLRSDRLGILLPLQEQLLKIEPTQRLADWGVVVTTLESFSRFLDETSPILQDNPGVAAGPDGRIYVVGGELFAGGALNVLEAYDVVASRWIRLAPMPSPRLQLGAATGGDGCIYAIGGQTSDGFLRMVEAYDPVGNAWDRRADMPTARSDAAIVTAPDGRIFVIGGLGATPMILDTAEVYWPNMNVWSQISPLRTARRGAAGAVGGDGRIYVMGGRLGPGGAETTNLVEAYDPLKDIWTDVLPMPTPRAWLAAATAPDGRIYAIGGHNPNLPGYPGGQERGYLRIVEIFDPTAGTWNQGPLLRTPRASHGAATMPDGRICVVGGAVDWLDAFEVLTT
jgi:protein kinase-like protein/Kelch motif protein